MAKKTNAIRLVETSGTAFEVRSYDLGDAAFSAGAVADALDLSPRRVFKTLLARGERTGPCFAVVPADVDLDLKALARAAGDRRVALAPLPEVEPLTGYPRGAVTALGAKKAYPVWVDLSAAEHETMAVSGGAKGLQILLAPDAYLSLTRGVLAQLARRA